MQGIAMAQKIAEVLYDKKAADVLALDVKSLTVLCEYMVIATGRSVPHVKALCDEVEEKLAEEGSTPRHVEGQNEGHWIVMDYGSIMVHIFHPEERQYYNLERLWNNGENKLVLPFDQTGEK